MCDPNTYCKTCLLTRPDWLSGSSWIPLAQTLLAITAAHCQFLSTPNFDSHPVIISPEYQEWMTCAGTCILYICGGNYDERRKTAEQVFLDWQFERRKTRRMDTLLPISFTFSYGDPTRASMSGMLRTLLLLCFTSNVQGLFDISFNLIKDQVQLQQAWTEADLLNIFTIISSSIQCMDTILLLQDIDECETTSRVAFWAILKRFAATTEREVKVVLTCRKSFDLNELRQIPVYKYNLQDGTGDSDNISEEDYVGQLVSSLCPGHHGETEIREKVQDLASMGKNLNTILKLIMDLTNWPQRLSARALDEFCTRLQTVTLSSTPSDVLYGALQDVSNQDSLRWIMEWLLHGYRSLTPDEAAMILCYCKHKGIQGFHVPSAIDLRNASHELSAWLCGITEVCDGQIRFRDSVRGLIEDDPSRMRWEGTPPDAILKFLINYLTAPTIQSRLSSMYNQYQAQTRSSENDITPPLVSDGQDIIFYAIQGFPYHLSTSLSTLKSLKLILTVADGALTPWSKAYWAMSNPFSRPKHGPLECAWKTLLASENLAPEAIMILQEVTYPRELQTNPDRSTRSDDMEYLSNAMRNGNEDIAFCHARQIIRVSRSKRIADGIADGSTSTQKTVWPSSFLWRATWLNMVHMVRLLLDDGMNPELDVAAYHPSPLHMAALLGHSLILDMLLGHGASIYVKRFDRVSCIFTAAAHGHIPCVKALISHDSSIMESRYPDTPLIAASVYGQWEMAEKLLEMGANPDAGMKQDFQGRWAPIVVAVDNGYLETARVLLKYRADPNISGPGNQDTPLWFAAIRAASVDCVRLLLENRADPNHDLLNPPLLIELMASKLPTEHMIAITETLVNNTPPVSVNVTDTFGMTPLLYAARDGVLPLVTFLLEHKAHINAKDKYGLTAIFHAVKSRKRNIIREVLKWKPELDLLTSDGEILFELAMEDAVIANMLAEGGVDLELVNKDGRTALNVAVAKKKPEIVRLLVNRKVNIHHRDQLGWSPIMDAVGYVPDAEITRILAEGGANLQDANKSGWTPLHFAMREEAEILKILLEFRKDIDLEKRDNRGETPLLWGDSMQCITLLVRAGADINTTGGKYGTALATACANLNLDLVTKFLKWGADPNISVSRFYGTALIAACCPEPGLLKKNNDKVEEMIRLLISYGADVNAIQSHTIYNALSAASLSARVSIVNYLLHSGASPDRVDPLGRLPIHFAAINGVENFKALALVHSGGLMVTDCAGKNVLHWAAQYEHVETIEFILDSLGSREEREHYINKPDIDGWTPLCWATRPLYEHFIHYKVSESLAYDGTIKYLLEHGADRHVEFNIGTGPEAETFTPVEMAKRCNAGEEIINLLTSDNSGEEDKDFRIYKQGRGFCDICLNVSLST